MINKIPSKVFYDDCEWNVEQIIHPNPYQDFLLLRREITTEAYDDNTPAIEYAVVDCHNQPFCEPCKETQEYSKTDSIKRREKLREIMEDKWMNLVSTR